MWTEREQKRLYTKLERRRAEAGWMDGDAEGAGVSPYKDMERSREMDGMEAIGEGR